VPRILILYSTVDGHTRRICERLRAGCAAHGNEVVLCAVDELEAAPFDIAAFDTLVIGASIRYGKHRRNVHEFIARHRELLEARACAFFSVNIVARKAQKNRPETNPYVQKFLRQTAWRPRLVEVFAGKLDYPKYGWLDRQMIRLIMKITGGPTDPSTVIDYTDWAAVDDLAQRVCAL
jgi:menaquinone-dependent protoporphyrinogen oxidase